MRHLFGIILAIVMAGAVFFGGAWGYLRLSRVAAAQVLPANGGALIHDKNMLLGLAALAGTGLLAGILMAAPRISALAAGLPGLLLLAWTGVYLVNVRFAVDLIPLASRDYGAGFKAMLESGLLGAAGLGMMIPLFVPSRWRRGGSAAVESADAEDYVASLTTPVPQS
ncbi:MAG TPA: hypothetical protein VFV41_02585 [Streptosporangiaceae bacterium]|nr:hypothetical protein [Streptosporangiaceae bacterium]